MDIVVVASIAFVCAGFIKGVLGFGFPIIALVLLTLSLGLGERRTMAGSGTGSGRAGAKHRPVNDANRKQGALPKGDRNT